VKPYHPEQRLPGPAGRACLNHALKDGWVAAPQNSQKAWQEAQGGGAA
jgi:hypothetical protein